MTTIVFFPPIADNARYVEQCIRISGDMSVIDFIELLKKEPKFAAYFARIAEYGSSGSLFTDVIVTVNGRVADELSQVHDGDVVKLLLTLAGG